MSLLRLLTAGKSLVGLQDSERRYRPSHPGAMPKFGTGKNRFRSTAKAKAETPAEPERQTSATPLAEPKASLFQAAPEPSEPGVTAGLRQKKSGWLGGWKTKLSSLANRPAALKKPVAKRWTKAPLQAELVLDSVKVVRNDLSDADLEVVAATRPRAVGASGTATARSRETVENREATWERVSTLFRAGKS